MTSSARLIISISTDHPSLPGHFPGRPVVPGAVILAEVEQLAATSLGGARIAGFPSVKFMSPMLPGQQCDLTVTDKGAGNATFELAHDGRRVASGQLRYEKPGPLPTRDS